MNKDMALIDFCESLLWDSEITEQLGWQKLIIIAEVGDNFVKIGGYSYNSQGECLMVSPGFSKPDELGVIGAIKKLHSIMKQENPTGRGWLKCMLRMSREGELGVDFEYDDPDRWSHTIDNYEERIKEYAAMPV